MKNTYDHRIKDLVIASGCSQLFEANGVKSETARNWLYGRYRRPIEVDKQATYDCLKSFEVKNLEKKVAQLQALIQLYQSVNGVVSVTLAHRNIKCRKQRKQILSSIQLAAKSVGIKKATAFIGISRSRYKRWNSRSTHCDVTLSDSCARSYPNQLSRRELSVIRELVTSKKFAHMSSRSLHLYAIKHEMLHCSPDTWYKYIDKHQWRRPFFKVRRKKFPGRVKRANAPNEILHIDITQIKDRGGKVYYLQTVLDNYSRYILAWKLHRSPLGANTVELIREAIKYVEKAKVPIVGQANFISDRGPENINSDVKTILDSFRFTHRLHKVHIRYSNNVLEVFFRSLKNNYLNYFPAKSKQELLRRLKFYIEEHNVRVPLSALGGATPREKYFNSWNPPSSEEIYRMQINARRQRIQENQMTVCSTCRKV
ncbi:MAG: DDE-type integrase/transposase/recombinase [Bdellovibrionota bacterium]